MTKAETIERRLEATTRHQKIVRDVEDKILSGEWPVGHRIPYEVDLAQQYGVSRETVSKALNQLVRAGLLDRIKKGGTFVRQPHTQSAVLEIGDIRREVESLNLAYAFDVTKTEHRRASRADLVLLDVPLGASLLEVSCIHTAGGKPFCLEKRLINLLTVPAAASVEFKDVSPSQWLVSQVPWTSAEHRIHAAPADDVDAIALDLAAGTACLIVERRTWSGAGPVTHVRLTYPWDRHTLVATFTPAS